MATFGIQVFNTDGFMTIDENFSTMQVLASGTATSNQMVYFPAQANRPLIMVSVPYGKSFLSAGAGDEYGYGPIITDPNSSFYLYAASGSAAFSYSYKVLTPRTNVGSSGVPWGLRVFRSDGAVLFDSGNLDTLRVLKYASAQGSNIQVSVADDGYPLYVNLDAGKFRSRIVERNGGAQDDATVRWNGYLITINNRTTVTVSEAQISYNESYPIVDNIIVDPQVSIILGSFI